MRVLAISALIFTGATEIADAGISRFFCPGAQELVDILAEGVDSASRRIADSPEFFMFGTIGGWRCLPEPLQMYQNGRAYIETLDCFFASNEAPVDEAELSHAGQIFQSSIESVLECFEGNILNMAPKSYSPPSRGESLIVVLNKKVSSSFTVQGHPLVGPNILIEYGYSRANPDAPLLWHITVGASISDLQN